MDEVYNDLFQIEYEADILHNDYMHLFDKQDKVSKDLTDAMKRFDAVMKSYDSLKSQSGVQSDDMYTDLTHQHAIEEE
ncbi:MAG: hypothetical protein AABZ32_00160, partial [Bacteroidota bacterium]